MNDLQAVVDQCRILLCQSPQAQDPREYLNNRLDEKTQEQFAFGFFPSGLSLPLLLETIGNERLQELGLIYFKTISDSVGSRQIIFNFFEHQPLIMPYRNVYGEIVALVGRCILSEEQRRLSHIEKYKNTPFIKGEHLFGLYEAKHSIIKENCVYIVEGQFDVIKAVEKGLTNVVALGSANMTSYQLSLLCRYTDQLIVLLDNDEAGLKGRRLIHEKYDKYAKIKDIYLPPNYKDIDEYLGDNGVDSLQLLAN